MAMLWFLGSMASSAELNQTNNVGGAEFGAPRDAALRCIAAEYEKLIKRELASAWSS